MKNTLKFGPVTKPAPMETRAILDNEGNRIGKVEYSEDTHWHACIEFKGSNDDPFLSVFDSHSVSGFDETPELAISAALKRAKANFEAYQKQLERIEALAETSDTEQKEVA